MSIEKRLRASVIIDAVNGDASERRICARQMLEAANEIARLRADAKRSTNYDNLAHEIWAAAQCCLPTEPIVDAVARIVALLHGAFPRRDPPEQPEPWQPISTAPTDGTRILVTNEDRRGVWIARYTPQYQSGYRPENPWQSMMLNCEDHHNNRGSFTPTNWMPLPHPATPIRTKEQIP